MNPFLRIVRLMTMVVWVGGLCFFAFVVAPVAFHVLPSTHQAGLVVAGTLNVLHPIGLISGVVFLLATSITWIRRRAHGESTGRLLLVAQLWLVVGMMMATAFVQKSIIPAMERDRISTGGDVDAVAPDNPGRIDFDRLHGLSEKVEGAALLVGLGVVVCLAIEGDPKTV